MRRIQTEQITGKEILAKDIYSSSGVVLISEGTTLKKAYISKLLELKITDVFVEDTISKDISREDITEEKISKQCIDKLQSTLESLSLSEEKESQQLIGVATELMEGVLMQDEVIYTISNVRNYSKSLYEHMLSVASLAVLIAIRAGYPRERVEDIATGALLHDIGFESVKADYKGMLLEDLEEEAQKDVKRHVVYGYIEVEHQTWLNPIAKEIILYHHERLNRTGYPFHIPGDKIKSEVRLVMICDAFDNMVYGNLEPRKKVYEALDEIMKNGGVAFDAELVKIFVRSVAAYPTGSLVSLSNGSRGIVIRQNADAPTRPIVRLLEKDENDEWVSKEEINLSEKLTLFIADTIE